MRYHIFRKDADSCKETATNCTCWSGLVSRIPSVKKCNIGITKLENFSIRHVINTS